MRYLDIAHRDYLWLAWLIGAAVFGVSASSAYRDILVLKKAHAGLNESLERRSAIDQLLLSLLDVETALRGFILQPADQKNLHAFRRARADFADRYTNVKTSLDTHSAQAKRLDELRPVLRDRLQQLEESVARALRASGDKGWQEERTTAGRILMDRIRLDLRSMSERETETLQASRTDVQHSSERFRVSVAAVAMYTLVILICVSAALFRQRRFLDRTVQTRTSALTAANAVLVRVAEVQSCMAKCATLIARAEDEATLFQDICRALVSEGGYRAARVTAAVDDGQNGACVLAEWNQETDSALHLPFVPSCGDGIQGGNGGLWIPLELESYAQSWLFILASGQAAADERETALLRQLTREITSGIAMIRARRTHDEVATALELSQARFAAFMQNLPGIGAILDRDGQIVFIKSPPDLEQDEREDLSGRNVNELSDHPLYPVLATRDEAAIFDKHEVVVSEEAVLQTRRVNRHFLTVQFPILPSSQPMMRGCIGIDISERVLAESALVAGRQLLNNLQRVGEIGSCEWEVDTGHIHWSDEMYRLFGLSSNSPNIEALIGTVHADDVAAAHSFFAACRRGEIPTEIDLRVSDGSGSPGRYCYIVVRAAIERDSDDRARTRVLATFQNVTRLKEAESELREANLLLERRVRERTSELEAANAELESFSYSVSHDLRAPLRAIDGYVQILLEDYQPLLDDEARRVCGVISDSARAMARLIDDLLTLSRTGRAELRIARLDMRGMANAIFHELTTSEMRRRIEFHLDDLPPTSGDPVLLRQVWINLLSNAIKFSGAKETAVIAVTGHRSGEQTTYEVRDNGVGFDMQYANKLFSVFQRLHRAADFEGTGVGLAIVQRIIHKHGGTVDASGQLGAGACFAFTLRAVEEFECLIER